MWLTASCPHSPLLLVCHVHSRASLQSEVLQTLHLLLQVRSSSTYKRLQTHPGLALHNCIVIISSHRCSVHAHSWSGSTPCRPHTGGDACTGCGAHVCWMNVLHRRSGSWSGNVTQDTTDGCWRIMVCTSLVRCQVHTSTTAW